MYGHFNMHSRTPGVGVNAPLDEEGRVALHLAAAAGDGEAVTKLLRVGANPNCKDNKGRTPLYEAIDAGNREMIALLLEKGATFRVQDDAGNTPVDYAISRKSDVGFLEYLASMGAVMSAPREDKKTALHVAAEAGLPEMISYLVSAGMKIDAKDQNGKTPLHIAVQNKNHAAMEMLIALGADAVMRDDDIMTPLHLAADIGDIDAVDILLSDAKVRRTINEFRNYSMGFTPLMTAAAAGASDIVAKIVSVGGDMNLTDNQNRHSLFIAAEYGRIDCVKRLIALGADTGKGPESNINRSYITHWISSDNFKGILLALHEAGIDINLQDGSGQTALHKACDQNDSDKIRALLDLGADPNKMTEYGKRPLDLVMEHYAFTFSDSLETIVMLLGKGADPNISSNANVSQAPLHIAARHGRLDVVDALARAKAFVDQRERNAPGMTPFLEAVSSGYEQVAFRLKDLGADVYKKDMLDRNVLHHAAESGVEKLVEFAAQLPKINIDAQDKNGQTALHHAARLEKLQAAEVLLKNGANDKLFNNDGMLPLHLAVEKDATGILELIERQGKGRVDWDVPARDTGDTPLHIGARTGYPSAVTKLLELGADPLKPARNGFVPLHYAILFGNQVVFDLISSAMKQRKADFNLAVDKNGWNFLHFAATREDSQMAQMLVAAGCDVNARATTSGDTPLHIAARAGSKPVAEFLMGRPNIDLSARNSEGLTPLDYALQTKNEEIALLIANAISAGTAAPAASKAPKPPRFPGA